MHHQHKLRDIRRTSAVAGNAGQSSKNSGRAAVVVVDAAENSSDDDFEAFANQQCAKQPHPVAPQFRDPRPRGAEGEHGA